jgi:hypothetical protein
MNVVRAMDFLSDKLFDGRPFRILTIVDCHTREALATVTRTKWKLATATSFASTGEEQNLDARDVAPGKRQHRGSRAVQA